MDPAAQVRDELLQRLAFFRLEPRLIVELGCGTGAGATALRRRFPRARMIAVDRDYAMTQRARRGQRFWRRFDCVCADGAALPFAARSADLVFCSRVEPCSGAAPALFGEARRVLQPGGLLLFATPGPDEREPGDATAARADMPQLGAALAHAGFVEPVLDRDRHGDREFIFGAAFAGRGDDHAGVRGDESVVPLGSVRTRPRATS
ncbi:MAG TPA: methyltransferase domain-containing protein [Steroidobacteraceae bacterium]|nr:methyltransferase domain-containing protein [Steroidobacteraceae bacterium]